MKKDTSKKIPMQKRKENLCNSLSDIEKFLCTMSKSFKCVQIIKHFK